MIIKNGYIIAVQTTDTDYDEIIQKISGKPQDPEGYIYELRADNYEWELVELPPEPEPDPNVSAEEALSILLGGVEA